MKELIDLFIVFLQIGLLSFGGGYASLPIIQEVIVDQRGWLSMVEMTDVITISQLTPGPIAVNAASFVGTKIAGIPGAIIATLGSIMPQTLIMILLATLLYRGKKIKILDKMLEALRPGVVGLIASATLALIISSVFPEGISLNIDFIALIGFIVGIFLNTKSISIFKLIGIGAILGIGMGAIEYLM